MFDTIFKGKWWSNPTSNMFFSKGLGGEKPPNERGASKEFDFLLLPPKKKEWAMIPGKSLKSPAIGEDLICVSFQLAVAWDFFSWN